MPRIVSLLASATEIVNALGLGRYQVGRSHECDYPEWVKSLPVCTNPAFPVDGSSVEIDRLVKDKLASAVSIYEVDGPVLDRLRPTHIITQTQCKVCAVSLEDVEKALAASVATNPCIVPLQPDSLRGIWDDIRRIASACEATQAGEELVSSLQASMEALEFVAHSSSNHPRVACIEWLEPLMATGNWVPELIAMANAENLFGEAGRHSPWMTWDELKSADPAVIISMPCGFDLARTAGEMHWLTRHPDWHNLRAVRGGQVYLVDGNQFMNRPGPRVVESLQVLAEILHPDVFQPVLEGVAWKRYLSS